MDFWQALQSIWQSPQSLAGVFGPLEPLLVQYMQSTDLTLTADNKVVDGTWGVVLAIANAFFLLLILVGAIQIMLAHSTGSLAIPVSQFVPRIVVTGFLMNLSFFLCRDLLIINNVLCGEIGGNLNDFFRQLNGSAGGINFLQGYLLFMAIVILLNVGILRLLFQAFERLVLWNLLFVLSPLAFLLSLLPTTAPFFSYWARMFVMVTLTQFVQFLAFALASAFLASVGQTGLNGFLVGVAMLFLVAKVPDLLARFPASGASYSRGIGGIISSLLIAVRLLAI